MGKFRVGLTRDFLNKEGLLNFDIGLDLLKENPIIEFEFFKEYKAEVTPDQIRDFDAVISLFPKFTKNSFKGVDRLVAIARCGVGFDMIDLEACTKANVMCFITPQGVRRPVAVTILTFILALSTRLLTKDHLVRTGRWAEKVNYMGWGITGKVVGTIGFGGIAKEFFKIAKPLNIEMLTFDPYVSQIETQELGVKNTEFKTLLMESDYLIITTPLTKSTYHMVGSNEINLMKQSSFLINVARGPVVDQMALTKALQERRISGAALDVFETEPIDLEDPLIGLDNVILTPHGLAWTDEMFRGMGEADLRGIFKIAQGLIPDNVVNTEVLEKTKLKAKLSSYVAKA